MGPERNSVRQLRRRVRHMGAAALLALCPAAVAPAADFHKSVSVDEGGSLRIDLPGGSIEIESHAEAVVRVDAYAQGLGARTFELALESDGDEVRLTGDFGGLLGGLLGAGPRLRVRVRVPREISLDVRTGGGSIDLEQVVGDVTARTRGGRVAADRVQGDVRLETSGGDVEASRIEGDLDARTSGGGVIAREIEGEVRARTSGGPIEILDVEGAVDARTSGGRVEVRFSGEPEGRLETSGGPIEVEFARGAGVDLDARTRGGRVEIEEPVRLHGKRTPGEVRGELNGGGSELVLRTSGGNIRIRER